MKYALFIGKLSDNAEDRAKALESCGYTVDRIRESDLISSRVLAKIIHKGYGDFIQYGLMYRLSRLGAFEPKYSLVFLNQCAYFGVKCIQKLRSNGAWVVNYINDDPFGNSKLRKWRLFLRTLPFLSAVIVVRDENIAEAKRFGSKKVIKVMMSAEESRHRALPVCAADRDRWEADIAFVGTWFPERGPFLAKLIEAGLNVAVYGNCWEKAPEWPILQTSFRAKMILGDDYVKAIQYAKINIGLLSKHNRDQYTTRSFEIPAIGSLFCAERTSVHTRLYREGVEAEFFDDVDECILKCRRLLADPKRINEIASAGHLRFEIDGSTNRRVMTQILDELEL